MKLGIIIDSASGLSEKEAKKRGWGFLPLHVFLDGVDYADGVDIDTKGVYNKLKLDTDVRTSASSPNEVIKKFEEMSKKYDQVIVYPLSSGLSSQNSNLMMFAKDFENINVVESHGLSNINILECEKAEELAKEGKDIDSIVSELYKRRDNHMAILLPHSLDWLVKGGRVGSTVASMATMLKIVPMISFQKGVLERYGKGRTFNKTLIKAAKDVSSKYGQADYELYVFHAGNKDIKEHLKRVSEAAGKEAKELLLPSTIALHVGLEAAGILAILK